MAILIPKGKKVNAGLFLAVALILAQIGMPLASISASAYEAIASSPSGGVCGIDNFGWTIAGVLARSGQPSDSAWECLKGAGFTTIIQQNSDSGTKHEQMMVESLGMTWIGAYGLPDNNAYSPTALGQMMNEVVKRLRRGQVILVHDTAGKGRAGFWEAAFLMWDGWTATNALDRFVAFGWKINGVADFGNGYQCPQTVPNGDPSYAKGSNGQYQAIQEIAALFGQPYHNPSPDTQGNYWAGCARPSYMNGWDYSTVQWPPGNYKLGSLEWTLEGR